MNTRAFLDDDAILHIYVAGSTSGGLGGNAGGWAWLATLDGAHFASDADHVLPPTNHQRAELHGLIMALSWAYGITSFGKAMVRTESAYLANTVQKWLYSWIRNGWTRKDGEIANLDLWQLAAPLVFRVWPTIEKVPRRTKDEYVCWCRDMAQARADRTAAVARFPFGPYSRLRRREAEAARKEAKELAQWKLQLMEVIDGTR